MAPVQRRPVLTRSECRVPTPVARLGELQDSPRTGCVATSGMSKKEVRRRPRRADIPRPTRARAPVAADLLSSTAIAGPVAASSRRSESPFAPKEVLPAHGGVPACDESGVRWRSRRRCVGRKSEAKATPRISLEGRSEANVFLIYGVIACRVSCGSPQRNTLAASPATSRSTSPSVAIEVSPGVVIASAPCATP